MVVGYKISNMEPTNNTSWSSAPAHDSDAPGKRIVIVEDDASLADIYKTRLEMIGYQCTVAADGIAALYFIQTQHPDLVLLDLMVPDIAGDEILRRMRASKWGHDIPVYIISNLNEADAPAGLRDLGIAGYAVKANLSNDMIDNLVNQILKPAGQTEQVLLEKEEGHEALPPSA